MGTINYGSSEIINLGVKPYTPNETDIKNYKIENECFEMNDTEIENALLENECDFMEMEYKEIESDIPLHLEFYEISLEPGYYEGYYLRIKSTYIYMENYEEKIFMNKELTRIKNFLMDCILNHGFIVYYPGWCTSYETPENSIELLNQAIKNERERIKNLYTEKQVCAMSAKERKAKLGLWW